MRIGVIGPVQPDSMADNLIDTLQAMGHEASSLGPAIPQPRTSVGQVALETARKLTPLDERVQSRVIDRAARAGPFDLVINVQGSMTPAVVAALKAHSRLVVLWFPDAVSNLGRLVMFAATYDALFFHEPVLVDRARAVLDLPVHLLPQGCHARWHVPPEGAVPGDEVVIAGTLHPWRVRILERLIATGVPVAVYGLGLPRWLDSPSVAAAYRGRWVTREDKARVFREAAVVLNSLHPAEIEGVNKRLFEGAGAGGVVVMDETAEVGKMFVPGKEVLTYRTFDELLGHVSHMRSDPQRARAIGDAASIRAHRDHTWDVRLTEMLDVLEAR